MDAMEIRLENKLPVSDETAEFIRAEDSKTTLKA
jgi:hypothetical protein